MNNRKNLTIAIDGYSSSGKSTMARELARRLGYIYVDSGAMYRAVTLYAIENGLASVENGIDVKGLIAALPEIKVSFAPAGKDGLQHTLLNGVDVEHEIRQMTVSSLVSPVAVIPEVRAAMVAQQQQMGISGGIVMDGRDIGTTVFPDADLKIFVDASPEVRAQRRADELREKGSDVNYNDILANIKERDFIDSTREVSPLRKADDALVLNNDLLTRDQQMEWLLNAVKGKTNELSN